MCGTVRKKKSINLWVAFYTLSCKARNSATSVTDCVGKHQGTRQQTPVGTITERPRALGTEHAQCDNAALTGDKLQSRTYSSVEPFHPSRVWDTKAVVLEKTGQERGHWLLHSDNFQCKDPQAPASAPHGGLRRCVLEQLD